MSKQDQPTLAAAQTQVTLGQKSLGKCSSVEICCSSTSNYPMEQTTMCHRKMSERERRNSAELTAPREQRTDVSLLWHFTALEIPRVRNGAVHSNALCGKGFGSGGGLRKEHSKIILNEMPSASNGSR